MAGLETLQALVRTLALSAAGAGLEPRWRRQKSARAKTPGCHRWRCRKLAPDLRSESLLRLSPILWAGFWLSAVSGAALLLAYPAKALTNPLLFVKLALVAASVVLLRVILRRVVAHRTETAWDTTTRRLAIGSLSLWLVTIFAGRLLAYTYNRLLAYAGL